MFLQYPSILSDYFRPPKLQSLIPPPTYTTQFIDNANIILPIVKECSESPWEEVYAVMFMEAIRGKTNRSSVGSRADPFPAENLC